MVTEVVGLFEINNQPDGFINTRHKDGRLHKATHELDN